MLLVAAAFGGANDRASPSLAWQAWRADRERHARETAAAAELQARELADAAQVHATEFAAAERKAAQVGGGKGVERWEGGPSRAHRAIAPRDHAPNGGGLSVSPFMAYL